MLTCKALNHGGLGRFGNQCFSLASTIGIAIKNNQPYAFPEWINRDNALFGGTPDRIEDYLVNPLPRLPEGLNFTDINYHWGYMEYKVPTGNWNICSHLQDTRYFDHCIDKIREIFTFKDEPEQSELIAIHYRAGDYTEGDQGHHPRCSPEYYKQAYDSFSRWNNFLIFTDDKDAAYKLFKEIMPPFMYQIVSGNYIEDFKLMKKCKSFITANSSYSFMAAVLGSHYRKRIIMPSRWFGKAWGSGYKELSKEIYPQNAIVI